ncbi:MAG: T9SS type A sorting domain-containing protein, partial [Candidatus Hatepunaea meridiana]|nr:T9SS type A sorting domain-containing protein [Candidatus Hatepunaea meridiana]
CADIGAFYFHLYPDISVEPEALEFTDLQIGTVDSSLVSIQNIGDSPLIVTGQTITPEGMPFTIGMGGGEFELEPDSIHQSWIIFSSEVQDEYEAAYCIESNDPDEDLVEIPLIGNALGVKGDDKIIPGRFALTGIYPNPFNSITRITFNLPRDGHVSITLTDLTGRPVATLVDDHRIAGTHYTFWNAEDYPAGVYLCRMEAEGYRKSVKMVLVK